MTENSPLSISAPLPHQLFLERPRIHWLLAKALEGYVVVISAGEGYGKTYAVSSFLRRRSETTIWAPFSELDNHPWRFWESYANAMGLCKMQAGKAIRKIGFPETAEQFDRWLEINRREFSLPGKYVVVRDDFHRVRSQTVLNFMEQALSFPIPNHTLILISRSEPPLNLVPALSKGRLFRIDAPELLFTRDEIADYFRMRRINVSGREITAIHRDTEGWPLAIDLLATELQKSGDRYTRPILEKGTFGILENDLFVAVSQELQRYLVKLSLFEQWPMELLKRTAATLPEKYRDSPELAAEMEKLSALIRYDYYLHGYRIHQVFLDYLRKKQKDISEEEIREVCGIAAQWYLENDLRMDAAINFERAKDYAGLANIADSFPRLIPRSAAPLLLEIIERLIQNNSGDDGAEESDGNYIYLRYIVWGRLLMVLSRIDEAVSVFKESIRRFEALPPSPASSRVLGEAWDYMGIITLARQRFSGTEAYIHCFEQAGRYYRRHPWPVSVSMSVCILASYVAQIGYPAPAGEFERQIESFVAGMHRAANSLNGYFFGLDDLVRTELAYFQGDLDAAEKFTRRAIIKARYENQYEIEHRALFFLLRIKLHRSAPENLFEAWKQADALLDVEVYNIRYLVSDIIRGWMYTHLGEPAKTPSWLKDRFEAGELYSVFRNFEVLIKAKYLFAEGRFADAASFLSLKEHKEWLGSFLLGRLEMNCLEAAARCRMGEKAEAAAILEASYRAAAPNSLVMPFIELGYEMRPLAAAALNGHGIPRPWLEDIRRRASAYGKSLSAAAECFRSGREVSPGSGAKVYLTRHERAVLDGLSRGQTRKEIAAVTDQPLSAVKSAISSICEKLGAVNRADAVRIASALGLLS